MTLFKCLNGAKDGDDAEVGNSNTGDRVGRINKVHFEQSRVMGKGLYQSQTMNRQNQVGGCLNKAVVETRQRESREDEAGGEREYVSEKSQRKDGDYEALLFLTL
jgi:hypothetical protein